jgi:hypothetical protein
VKTDPWPAKSRTSARVHASSVSRRSPSLSKTAASTTAETVRATGAYGCIRWRPHLRNG